jgi:hypothetical protein
MGIEFGHFRELKQTIGEIADSYKAQGPKNAEILPLDQPLMGRLKWMCMTAKSVEKKVRCLELCRKFGMAELFDEVARTMPDEESCNRRPESHIETLNLEEFLKEVSEGL